MNLAPRQPSLSDSDRDLRPVIDSLRDISLVQRMARGDRDALAELFDRLAPFVLGTLVHRLGRRELADAILEETFLAAWEQAHRFRPEHATPRGWLLRLARAETHRLRGPERISGPVDPSLIAGALAAEPVRWNRASEALSQLPAEQRACIELAIHGGLSQTQIAERLGRPRSTVKTRILAAMNKLRRVLSA